MGKGMLTKSDTPMSIKHPVVWVINVSGLGDANLNHLEALYHNPCTVREPCTDFSSMNNYDEVSGMGEGKES